jgi:hypothetical protein
MGLGITTAVLSLGIVFGYGIPVVNRIIDVNTAQDAAASAEDANHFWRMVAGHERLETGTDLGRLAAVAREKATGPDPFEAFKEPIAPGELPDIGDRLGFHAFDRPDPNNSRETVTDSGHFTEQFVLYAVEATGALHDGSVDALIRPNPDVPDYGQLRWEWGTSALAGLLALSGLFWLWLRRDRRRWPARAEARALAALTDEQRQVYRIITALEEEPDSKERTNLLKQAKELFSEMGRGLDTRDKVAALSKALAEAAETWEIKRQVYEELGELHGRGLPRKSR